MNGTSRLRNHDDFSRIIEIRRPAELLFEDERKGTRSEGEENGRLGRRRGERKREKDNSASC